MSEDTKQTATTDTDATAKPDAEAKGAPEKETDDFDKALAEYDEDDKPKPSSEQQKPPAKSDGADLRAEIDQLREEILTVKSKEKLDKLVAAVRGDLDPEIADDDMVIGWLDRLSRRDERLLEGYKTWEQNPKRFQKVIDGLHQKLAAKFKPRVDQEATDTKEAVADAVRRGSGKPPEGKAPDFSGASNAEFKEKVEKEFGYTPQV